MSRRCFMWLSAVSQMLHFLPSCLLTVKNIWITFNGKCELSDTSVLCLQLVLLLRLLLFVVVQYAKQVGCYDMRHSVIITDYHKRRFFADEMYQTIFVDGLLIILVLVWHKSMTEIIMKLSSVIAATLIRHSQPQVSKTLS